MKKIILYCFPHAGGSAMSFQPWNNLINTRFIDFQPMELPGRGRRFAERLCLTMDDAVEDAYQKISTEINKYPYAFFGHSLGCLLTYELAHRIIRNSDNCPVHIFFSGHSPGDCEKKVSFTEERLKKFVLGYRLDEAALLNVVNHTRADNRICFAMTDIEKIRHSHPSIYHALSIKCSFPPDLEEEDFLRETVDKRSANREIFDNKELKSLFIPILRADHGICYAYRWHPKPLKLKSDITVLYGTDDENVIKKDIEHWKDHTERNCRVVSFNGDHFFFETNVNEIVGIINETLSAYLPK